MYNEISILTKIPLLRDDCNQINYIRNSIENSVKNLKCNIDTLFFHNAKNSNIILQKYQSLKYILNEYSINTLGVSVYEPIEVDYLKDCKHQIAFQFPLNFVDRRFEDVSMSEGKRYARSIFLQGLLVSDIKLKDYASNDLKNFTLNIINF